MGGKYVFFFLLCHMQTIPNAAYNSPDGLLFEFCRTKIQKPFDWKRKAKHKQTSFCFSKTSTSENMRYKYRLHLHPLEDDARSMARLNNRF